MERTLTMLAARFRKMLEAQTKIYEGTKRVDRIPEADRGHDQQIETARLSREKDLVGREADRACVLLREEGSSMAFPETVSLMRKTCGRSPTRLADAKVGQLTQDSKRTYRAARRNDRRARQSGERPRKEKDAPGPVAPPQPGDPPLVDKLAELKMIRSLQMRINRRTQSYSEDHRGRAGGDLRTARCPLEAR